ncbi:beta-N-acetylhexosaminidase [Abyssalbus ytuae]|uniref:beta-N-acetylhexosaminidase n=1 Tax=Abyssalbus ytuae TaxID=2926907 RepID=A0A9E6ZV71_9FLAO|nr:beta-N-acetylhexosaminidase [Abyssalbus ytuae]UOB18388.1 beta-N-acetylhexosaminidase [Abyssalbus ytuae]
MNTLKNKFAFALLVLFIFVTNAQVNIIPCPENIEIGQGSYILNNQTTIISGPSTQNEARYLASVLTKAFNKKPAVKPKGKKGIFLNINPGLEKELGKEGYLFKSEKKKILIEGATSTGLFYGIQTLRQLLPADFEFMKDPDKNVAVPVVKITDKPRFPWRAFMLDESRHFKGAEVVKKLLDQMALLKMNVFHWHLTDDQGWRIEIKKYPDLTKTGAYRKDTQSSWRNPERYGEPHGGFYTQEQIREIINYAGKRHIKIIPEIEMPGHATAAIASYPWLGILGTTNEVSVVFGKMEDSFNVANPKVYEFLTDVLTEVFELFPENIVHIGGDEVMFDAWKNSQSIQDKINKEGLASPADLQIFFTNQISNFMEAHGHRMMGWNEILGANVHEWHDDSEVQVKQQLAPSAIIHFWKGDTELIKKAVASGHDVVNSLHSMTYLDYNYKKLPLSRAYSFDPVPEGLDEKYNHKILGLGCQMWSEWIPEVSQMENQVFPRIAAYAEVGWTSKSNKNYDKFTQSLDQLKKRWKLSGIKYHEQSN